jgi:6-pyruvoyl-tetrahydropterin synthase
MNILFVEELSVIDFSYPDHKRGLLGESYILDVELHGDLDNEKVIFDFSYAKKTIKTFIDSNYDHKLWVPLKSKYLELDQNSINTKLRFKLKDLSVIEHTSPNEALSLIDLEEISMDAMSKIIERELLTVLPENIHSVRIFLRIEEIAGAYFHYSHGLKQHYGNCQRIAHGHRSKVIVLKNGIRHEESELFISKKLKDSYIGIKENVLEEIKVNDIDHIKFSYQAQQGNFELIVPSEHVLLIENETTIECISEYFAKQLFSKYEKKWSISVRVYEGVKKGAIYTINC